MRSHHPQSARPASAGFSLIELLMVIVIIASLIAILLPSLSSVRDLARIRVCDANLRTLAQAMAQYMTGRNRDLIPVLPPAIINGVVPPRRTSVHAPMALLTDYIDSPLPETNLKNPPRLSPWSCPSDQIYSPVFGMGYEYVPLDYLYDPLGLDDPRQFQRRVSVGYELGLPYFDTVWRDLNMRAHQRSAPAGKVGSRAFFRTGKTDWLDWDDISYAETPPAPIDQ